MQGENTSFDEIKNLLASGDFAQAFSLSKNFARENIADYNLLERLFKRIQKSGALLSLKPVKLAILADSTTQFLRPIISLFCALRGMNLEIYASEFASFKRDILDENSDLYAFKPDAILLLPSVRNFYFAENFSADEFVREYISFWEILKARTSAEIIHANFDLPTFEGILAHSSKVSRAFALRSISCKIFEEAQTRGVSILDLSLLQAQFCGQWSDSRLWYTARQHPSLNALPVVCDAFSRILRAKFFASKKVLVTDLDNVLWGGAVSELGLNGIVLGSPSAQGEAYCDFQRYLLSLKNRGVLLSVVSKNDLADVEDVLKNHSACVLRQSDFVAIKANWNLKSQNILELSESLNLNLDSFVFIDDNSLEIAEVKSRLPEVECVLMQGDVCDFVERLSGFDFFDLLDVSDDDILRTKTYADSLLRKDFSAKFESADDYLKSLEMTCEVLDIAKNVSRVSQLFMRTNRFNLTDSRLSESALSSLNFSDDSLFAKCYLLSDKFGSLGIVGALIAKKSDKNSAWEISDFAMSCRALSRNLEHFMMLDFCEFLKSKEQEEFLASFVLTEKNASQKDFYKTLGFEKICENGAKEIWKASIKNLKISSPKILRKA